MSACDLVGLDREPAGSGRKAMGVGAQQLGIDRRCGWLSLLIDDDVPVSRRIDPDLRAVAEAVVGHSRMAGLVDVDGLAASLLDGNEDGCSTPHPLCYPISNPRAHLILRAPGVRGECGAHLRVR